MSSKDEEWKELNKELIEHAKNWDWGLYRNTRLEMYKFLKDEGQDHQALGTLLEICYLDINGPRNCGGNFDPELLEELPAWEEANNWVAPSLIKWANKLIVKLELSREDVHILFNDIAEKNYQLLKLPVAPEQAWDKLSKEI